jgi:uncharacterized LabA/DUF88 family protein
VLELLPSCGKCLRLKPKGFKGTDLSLLAQELLKGTDQIECIRYFTADVSPRAGDPEAPKRQQSYFRALKTIPELHIHKGKFLTKKIHRPIIGQSQSYVFVNDTEEKGSDVNLASHLLMDGFCDSYDVALVMSQDTDLLEAMRMVRDDLNKEIVVAWFDGSDPGKKHKKVASAIRHVTNGMLTRSQFPNPVIGRGGKKYTDQKTGILNKTGAPLHPHPNQSISPSTAARRLPPPKAPPKS